MKKEIVFENTATNIEVIWFGILRIPFILSNAIIFSAVNIVPYILYSLIWLSLIKLKKDTEVDVDTLVMSAASVLVICGICLQLRNSLFIPIVVTDISYKVKIITGDKIVFNDGPIKQTVYWSDILMYKLTGKFLLIYTDGIARIIPLRKSLLTHDQLCNIIESLNIRPFMNNRWGLCIHYCLASYFAIVPQTILFMMGFFSYYVALRW